MLFQFLCKYSEYFLNTYIVFVTFIILFASKCRFALNLPDIYPAQKFLFQNYADTADE